ncbi:hypothetical protein GE061_015444 [Apolygus lucorum]|uniref:Single domain-containing protein n=1 Tax=Apolygus lucorum TaxID=248454 RepID=A0A8S9XQ19_APOLU|nr:hypothetical protein GE061_015444 [Apolygus lucorum]
MKVLLILSALVGVAFSATAIAPAHGKYCYHEKHRIGIGMTYYPPGECMEITCEGSGGEAKLAHYLTCPPAPVTDSNDLVIVERRELKYPKCCPTLSRKIEQESPSQRREYSINDIPDDMK